MSKSNLMRLCGLVITISAVPSAGRGANVNDFVDFSLRSTNGALLLPGRLYVPPEAANPAQPRPLITFLHGAGESGTNNVAQVNQNIDNLLAEAKQRGAFLYAPQTNNIDTWAATTATANTMAMINRALAEQNVDMSRLYVTGLSMGGGGVWNMLNRFPDRFAAAVPIAAVSPASGFLSSNLAGRCRLGFSCPQRHGRVHERHSQCRQRNTAGRRGKRFPRTRHQTTPRRSFTSTASCTICTTPSRQPADTASGRRSMRMSRCTIGCSHESRNRRQLHCCHCGHHGFDSSNEPRQYSWHSTGRLIKGGMRRVACAIWRLLDLAAWLKVAIDAAPLKPEPHMIRPTLTAAKFLCMLMTLAIGSRIAAAADVTFNISLVGESDPFPGSPYYADVWAEGNYAYVGSDRPGGGIAIFDIFDPSAPQFVTMYPGSEMEDVEVHNGIGYFGSDVLPTTSGTGVDIVDLSNPASPVMLSRVNSLNGGHNKVHTLTVNKGFLYTADNATDVVKIFNVANPSSPQFVKSLDLGAAYGCGVA